MGAYGTPKFTVTFKVKENGGEFYSPERLEVELKDLLSTSVLPALELEIVPLTFTVKKARGY